jgi:RNA polymerase sigma-70 factor (ECF subfamily)
MNAVARAIDGIAVRRSRDADIFDRALRGDPVAFAEVYRRYRDRVYAYCLSRLLSRDAAADAMQEVFLRALSADPDKVASPAGWLFGVARNVCTDCARRSNSIDLGYPEDAASAEHSSTAETAEDAAIGKQAVSSALIALRRMNPRYRSALILRDVHQQSIPDVALALGVETDAAYTILSRARDAFGRTYAEVLNLRPACRQAVELSYRQHGSGISTAEKSVLESHRRVCASCRRETAPAARKNALAGLALLASVGSASRSSVLTKAASMLGSRAWPWEALSRFSPEWSVAKMAATGLATAGVAALVAIPGASTPAVSAPAPAASACTSASPTAGSMGVGKPTPGLGPQAPTQPRPGPAACAPATTPVRTRVRAQSGSGGGQVAATTRTRKSAPRPSGSGGGAGSGSGSSGGAGGSSGSHPHATPGGSSAGGDTGQGSSAGQGQGAGATGSQSGSSGSTASKGSGAGGSGGPSESGNP